LCFSENNATEGSRSRITVSLRGIVDCQSSDHRSGSGFRAKQADPRDSLNAEVVDFLVADHRTAAKCPPGRSIPSLNHVFVHVFPVSFVGEMWAQGVVKTKTTHVVMDASR